MVIGVNPPISKVIITSLPPLHIHTEYPQILYQPSNREMKNVQCNFHQDKTHRLIHVHVHVHLTLDAWKVGVKCGTGLDAIPAGDVEDRLVWFGDTGWDGNGGAVNVMEDSLLETEGGSTGEKEVEGARAEETEGGRGAVDSREGLWVLVWGEL